MVHSPNAFFSINVCFLNKGYGKHPYAHTLVETRLVHLNDDQWWNRDSRCEWLRAFHFYSPGAKSCAVLGLTTSLWMWRTMGFLPFSRMRSEGSRFTWGSGGEAVFAKFCVCGRNRSQPSATVRVSAVRLSTVASASGGVQKACQVECLSPQLYWCLQGRCQWEWSVSTQLYWCLQKRCLWEWSVSPQLYWCLQRRCLCERSVSPQLYWRLQRRCLCEWSVAPQLYWCLQRRCQWEWSVSPQLYWRAEEVSVWVICVAAVILVSAEQVSLRVICVVAVILVFAEDVSVWVICVPAEGQVRVSYKSVM